MYGTKIKNLIKMKNAGINIPNFDIVKCEEKSKKINIEKYHGKYAIRSSSNIEDGKFDSFAGQFDTYLNVSINDIEKRCKNCFESLYNENVLDYIKAKKIEFSSLKMDVIIQEMVNSEYSGILFTSNPQGILNETVIVVGKGLGNNVVEDKIDTTSYYYNTTDDIYYYEGKEEYLTKEIVEELIKLSKKIKNILGEYLDIEFAIEKDKIYILQARTITTLDTNNLLILDNSNIVESYPGVSLPLTISLVKSVYSGVFRGVSYRILKNKKVLEKYSNNFNNMVGASNGRIYYKISNWYTLIKFLPLSSKIIPIWQDMLGVKNKSYDSEKVEIPFTTRIKTYYNAVKEIKNAPKNMEILNNKFININNYFHSHFKETMTNKEIINLYNKIQKEILEMWDVTLVNDLYSFIFTGLLKKRLKKKKLSEEKVNEYISGISNIESLKPIESLISIAYNKDRISKEDYEKEKSNYIYLYGDRNLEELKLESETFRSSPDLLNEKIKEYRQDNKKLEELYKNINHKKSIPINEDFITKYISKKAMLGIKNREVSRLNRSRIYGMVRGMVHLMGKNLVKEKKLDNYKDVLYLSLDELFNSNEYNLKEIVKERKDDYNLFYQLPNYSRIVFSGQEFDKRHKCIKKKTKYLDNNKLEGIGSSNGVAEGYALVIEDINNNYQVKDKILVTKMTDPGWVFLLATSKGVISEKGSLLSHTAIISRELKIPSIVGVEDATSSIRTGDYIKMDGSTGKIEILKRGKK